MTNKWAQKSIELANNGNYLDHLNEVYPVEVSGFRTLDSSLISDLSEAIKRNDPTELFRLCLELPVFPLEHPYVAYFRYNKENFIEKNPEVTREIGKMLMKLRVDEIIALGAKPKRAVKRYGQAFRTWLMSLGYKKVNTVEFQNSRLDSDEIIIHKGYESQYMDFANSVLRCGLVRKPDLLIRKGDRYIIGEAKFLTDMGGGQDDKFDEAMNLLRGFTGRAHRIAVLDGPLWVEGPDRKQTREVRNAQADVMSALILRDFLESF